MKLKKFVSTFMAAVLISSSVPMNIFANDRTFANDSVIEYTDVNVSGSSIEVEFNVTGQWTGGYNAEMKIKNNGDKELENWTLQFDFDEEITNIWNANIIKHSDNTYIIKNNTWNNNIPANSEVNFGFSGTCGETISEPINYAMLSNRKESSDEDYSIEFQVMNDWESGYTAQITITNTGDKIIEGWKLEFDFDKPIDEIWNAYIDKNVDGHYNIINRGYNANIGIGESITFGFSGNVGKVTNNPANYILTESGIKDIFELNANTPQADSTNEVNSDCVLFAQEGNESISLEASNLNINGNIYTNGIVNAVANNKVINGTIYQSQKNSMLDYNTAIENKYYKNEVNIIRKDYYSETSNETIKVPTIIEGEFTSDANLSVLDTAVMSIGDIKLNGSTFNSNNAVIYSQFGDIIIESDNISANGLLYAPFGSVFINSKSINIVGSIVAQNIYVKSEGTININNSTFINSLGNGKTKVKKTNEEDEDILDIGKIYYKDIENEDEIIPDGNGGYCVKNQFLISANEDVDYNTINDIITNIDAKIVGYIELTNDYQIEFNKDTDIGQIKEVIAELSARNYIDNASLNIVVHSEANSVTSDTEWLNTWDEEHPDEYDWGVETIKLKSALENLGVISTNGITTDMLYNVKIGLIDSFFSSDHDDLTFTKTWNNPKDVGNDENIKDYNSNDIYSHGTKVAGIMAADFNNEYGITGTCVKHRLYGFSKYGTEDKNIKEVITTMGRKYTETSLFEDKYALAMLIGNNVKVINISMGLDDAIAFSASQGNEDAIKYLEENSNIMYSFLRKFIDKGYDFIIVVAAGNGNNARFYECTDENCLAGYVATDSDTDYDSKTIIISKPCGPQDDDKKEVQAQYSSFFLFESKKYADVQQRIVCVGSIGCGRVKSKVAPSGIYNDLENYPYYFSEYCNIGDRLNILAPGESVNSTVLHNDFYYKSGYNYDPNFYDGLYGTSMAAPFVSGILGLSYSINPSLDATLIRNSVIYSALKEKDAKNREKTLNILNAADTVKTVKKVADALEPTEDDIVTNQYNGFAIGIVQDDKGNTLADVNVTASCLDSDSIQTEYNRNIDVVQTDAYGTYTLGLTPGKYMLEFEKKGYQGIIVYCDIQAENTVYIDTVKLPKKSGGSNTIKLKVVNAINGTYEDAEINILNGWNNHSTDYEEIKVKKSANFEVDKEYTVKLKAGAYTAKVSKEGYIDTYVNILSAPDLDVQYASITPILPENEYRIILTWGEQPYDLDSHIAGVVEGKPYHVCYYSKTYNYDSTNIANLDWDDVNSYGPETITYTSLSDNSSCSYYVHDYSNRGNSSSNALSYSSAKVTVYKGNELVKVYNVPIGYSGTKWNVFTIDSTGIHENGSFTE